MILTMSPLSTTATNWIQVISIILLLQLINNAHAHTGCLKSIRTALEIIPLKINSYIKFKIFFKRTQFYKENANIKWGQPCTKRWQFRITKLGIVAHIVTFNGHQFVQGEGFYVTFATLCSPKTDRYLMYNLTCALLEDFFQLPAHRPQL